MSALQEFLTRNINRPEYQQRWPNYKTRKAELIRIFEQGEASQPKESPSDRPKRKAKKKKK